MIQWAFLFVVFTTLYVSCTTNENDHSFGVDLDGSPIRDVDERFLSVAFGRSGLVKGNKWHGELDFSSVKLRTLSRGLSPAYLRVGGHVSSYMYFGDVDLPTPGPGKIPFHISESNITTLTSFCRSVGYDLILNLNAWTRTGDDWDPYNPKSKYTTAVWEPSNSIQLLRYMASQEGMMDGLTLMLGNEPNSYLYSMGVELTPAQVANDFLKLVDIVRTDPEISKACTHCKLVGPDTTRPNQFDVKDWSSKDDTEDLQLQTRLWAHELLQDYLPIVESKKDSLDAITFHSYYVDAKKADLAAFVSPAVLDALPQQIKLMRDIATEAGYLDIPMWLTETSAAWGGGGSLSTSYASGFMWLDKLGVAARDGIDAVMRQTLYGSSYGLLNRHSLRPTPDYWLSFLYKKLVGERVLRVNLDSDTRHLRLYAHCTSKRSEYPSGSVVFYGLNLYDHAVNVSMDLKIGAGQHLDKYLLTPDGELNARNVKLNGEKLMMLNDETFPPIRPDRLQSSSDLHFPAKTFGYYVLSGAGFKACIPSDDTE